MKRFSLLCLAILFFNNPTFASKYDSSATVEVVTLEGGIPEEWAVRKVKGYLRKYFDNLNSFNLYQKTPTILLVKLHEAGESVFYQSNHSLKYNCISFLSEFYRTDTTCLNLMEPDFDEFVERGIENYFDETHDYYKLLKKKSFKLDWKEAIDKGKIEENGKFIPSNRSSYNLHKREFKSRIKEIIAISLLGPRAFVNFSKYRDLAFQIIEDGRYINNHLPALISEIQNYRNKAWKGWSHLLFHSIRHNNTVLVEEILKKRNSVDDFSDSEGNTPLMIATLFKRKHLAKKLLSMGVDLNAETVTGGTAVYAAAISNDVELYSLYRNSGAKPTNAKFEGIPLFHSVVQNQYAPMIKLLINDGLDTTLKDNKGQTALFYAFPTSNKPIDERNKDIIELLIDSGIDPNLRNNNGDTAFESYQNRRQAFLTELNRLNALEKRKRLQEKKRLESQRRKELEAERVAQEASQGWDTFFKGIALATPFIISELNGMDIDYSKVDYAQLASIVHDPNSSDNILSTALMTLDQGAKEIRALEAGFEKDRLYLANLNSNTAQQRNNRSLTSQSESSTSSPLESTTNGSSVSSKNVSPTDYVRHYLGWNLCTVRVPMVGMSINIASDIFSYSLDGKIDFRRNTRNDEELISKQYHRQVLEKLKKTNYKVDLSTLHCDTILNRHSEDWHHISYEEAGRVTTQEWTEMMKENYERTVSSRFGEKLIQSDTVPEEMKEALEYPGWIVTPWRGRPNI